VDRGTEAERLVRTSLKSMLMPGSWLSNRGSALALGLLPVNKSRRQRRLMRFRPVRQSSGTYLLGLGAGGSVLAKGGSKRCTLISMNPVSWHTRHTTHDTTHDTQHWGQRM
jgi:hypothetical protein